MSFTSFHFLVFLFAVSVLYYAVPKRFQWCLLLVASYAFYLFSGVPQVAYLAATTLINYTGARIMQGMRDRFRARTDLTREQRREQKKAVNRRIHRVQVIVILVDLVVLGVVKYLDFFIANVNSLFTLFRYDAQMPLINIIVPLGISFYTFASIGYVIDVGRGKYDAERNLAKFALFVSFFPSIVQGPINRFNDLGAQLTQPHRFDYENITFGTQLVLWGFFKKLVIADRAAVLVGSIFVQDISGHSGSVMFFGALVYALQIYCDFSGGIDIARGASQMLGIDLPRNFSRPYFATSVADYWRRWHMTLGSWMRDYVFYPIMLSKAVTRLGKVARKHMGSYGAKVVPSVISTFIVFFLIGIWHGANWRYIAFGLYNAMVVAGGVAFAPLFDWLTEKLKIRTEVFSWKLFRIVRTFLVFTVSKIIVRSWSLRNGLSALKKIATDVDLDFCFGVSPKLYALGLNERNMFILALSAVVLFVISLLQERGIQIRAAVAKQQLFFRWGLYLILLAAVLVFGMYGPAYSAADFIYQGY